VGSELPYFLVSVLESTCIWYWRSRLDSSILEIPALGTAGVDPTAMSSKALALEIAGAEGTAVSSKALARFAVALRDISALSAPPAQK
jgi:hypothetical protein